jgi:hypothetical protein
VASELSDELPEGERNQLLEKAIDPRVFDALLRLPRAA